MIVRRSSVAMTISSSTAKNHCVAIHAYVLMTNHVHLLATPRFAPSVPKMTQAIGRVYVQHFSTSIAGIAGRGTLWAT